MFTSTYQWTSIVSVLEQPSHEKKPGGLDYIGDDILPKLYPGNIVSHEPRVPINQPVDHFARKESSKQLKKELKEIQERFHQHGDLGLNSRVFCSGPGWSRSKELTSKYKGAEMEQRDMITLLVVLASLRW